MDNKHIPKILLQTSIEDPDAKHIKLITSVFPEWSYFHFHCHKPNDNEILKYFKNNPLPDFPNIIEKFKTIKVGAFKSDMFRYYFLYKNGGVYLDDDAMLHCNIDFIIKEYNSVFIKSNFFPPPSHCFNGFICTYPRNPVLFKTLQHMYNTDFTKITNYQIFCEELLVILNDSDLTNVKIYNETTTHEMALGYSTIFDNDINDINKKALLTHYYQKKIIPDNHKIININ